MIKRNVFLNITIDIKWDDCKMFCKLYIVICTKTSITIDIVTISFKKPTWSTNKSVVCDRERYAGRCERNENLRIKASILEFRRQPVTTTLIYVLIFCPQLPPLVLELSSVRFKSMLHFLLPSSFCLSPSYAVEKEGPRQSTWKNWIPEGARVLPATLTQVIWIPAPAHSSPFP